MKTQIYFGLISATASGTVIGIIAENLIAGIISVLAVFTGIASISITLDNIAEAIKKS